MFRASFKWWILLAPFVIFSHFGAAQELQTQPTQSLKLDVLWGQSSEFWNTVETLQHASDSAQMIDKIFESSHAKPTEGLGSASLTFDSWSPDSPNHGGLSLGYEFLGGGEIYNRISPEIKGYLISNAVLKMQLLRASPLDADGWNFHLSTNLGIGEQKIIRGPVSDYLLETPVDESTVFYYGADLGAGYQTFQSENLKFNYGLLLSPTFFHSDTDDAQSAPGVQSGTFRLRWQTRSEGVASWGDAQDSGVELGAQIIGGQQPVPYLLTPRFWDSVHEVELLPAFGSVLGLGGVLRAYTLSRNLMIEMVGGFYGGYLGAGAKLKIYFFDIEAGSFGLEQSPGFRLRESRIKYLHGALTYEW